MERTQTLIVEESGPYLTVWYILRQGDAVIDRGPTGQRIDNGSTDAQIVKAILGRLHRVQISSIELARERVIYTA